MKKIIFLFVLSLLVLSSRAVEDSEYPTNVQESSDPNSYSNPDEVKILHEYIYWKIDFENKQIQAAVNYTMEAIIKLQYIYLDILGFDVDSVTAYYNNEVDKIEPTKKTYAFGSQLVLKLGRFYEKVKIGDEFTLEIKYVIKETLYERGISFLWANQTQSGLYGMVYTFNKPCYARNYIPSQDTPSVRFPYHAEISVPISYQVYMSANLTSLEPTPGEDQYLTYKFVMGKPVPQYLISIIAGYIAREPVGDRTYILADPKVISDYTKEFYNLEAYVDTIENYLKIELEWGQYKQAIMPPNFPYFGSHDPLLVMSPPSIVAGDKSGQYLTLREIAHQWIGDLISITEWRHSWFTEGLSTFLERKALEEDFGTGYSQVQSMLGQYELKRQIKEFGEDSDWSSLQPKFKDKDPRRYVESSVPREKGFQFILYLEQIVNADGGDMLELFLLEFINSKRYACISTDDFKTGFMEWVEIHTYNPQEILAKIDWDAWLITPGLPPITHDFSSSFTKSVLLLAEAFIQLGGTALPHNYQKVDNWSSNQIQLFMQYMRENKDRLNKKIIKLLENTYNFSTKEKQDLKVTSIWMVVQIESKFPDMMHIENFLKSTGQISLICPVYQALIDINKREKALEIYESYIDYYHAFAREEISRIVYL